MELKSLLAIASCSAIALSIGVSTIAETVKDSQIKLEPTGIDNKDYRNKQSTPSIIGNWKASVNEKGRQIDIYFNVKSDGTYDSIFQTHGRRGSGNGNWKYSNNVLIQTDNQGVQQGRGTVKWISNDEFILTIQDNGDPYYEGVQRRYYRQPVQTSQQNGQGDKYGSIAVHAYGSYWGAAWNHSNPESASNVALKSCFESSRGKCKTAITFKNGCGALATAIGRYGTAADIDEQSAQYKALEVCGNDFCRIKKVICNN